MTVGIHLAPATNLENDMASYLKCTQCDKEKQRKEFHKDSSRKSGRRSACKVCEGVGKNKHPELQDYPIELLNSCWKPTRADA